jgi:hypothetical protein
VLGELEVGFEFGSHAVRTFKDAGFWVVETAYLSAGLLLGVSRTIKHLPTKMFHVEHLFQ